jgi:hypothetical protein
VSEFSDTASHASQVVQHKGTAMHIAFVLGILIGSEFINNINGDCLINEFCGSNCCGDGNCDCCSLGSGCRNDPNGYLGKASCMAGGYTRYCVKCPTGKSAPIGALSLSSCVSDVIGASSQYVYYDDLKTWTDAEASCVSKGGHLASIASDAENQMVYQKIISTLTCDGMWRAVWLGMNDLASQGTYVWTDKSPATYFKWNSLSPSRTYQGRPENCVVMFTCTAPQYMTNGVVLQQWNDASCTLEQYPYICEFPTRPSGVSPTPVPSPPTPVPSQPATVPCVTGLSTTACVLPSTCIACKSSGSASGSGSAAGKVVTTSETGFSYDANQESGFCCDPSTASCSNMIDKLCPPSGGQNSMVLILGLTLGLGLPSILLAILAVCYYR